VKTDSIAAALAAHRNVSAKIEWPADAVTKFDDDERQSKAQRIFDSVIEAREISEWRRVDVLGAARLALVQVHLDAVDRMIAQQGYTTLGGKSGAVEVASPLLASAASLQARAMTLSRQLSQFGVVTDRRRIEAGARAQVQAREVISRASDPLLAGYGDDLI
jgi:hypothetical protein